MNNTLNLTNSTNGLPPTIAKYGDPVDDQLIYNRDTWWPWFSDNKLLGLVMLFFFLIWNTGISLFMTYIVLGPVTRGMGEKWMCYLCIAPHWYIGIILPFSLGGLIPGFMTLIPWVFAICCTCR
jgi:hypothetical protein